jgi:thiamine-phosphate diphosphorylase
VCSTSPKRLREGSLHLIVVTDAALAGTRSVRDIVRAAVAAGAPAIQLRDKSATARELAQTGRELLEISRAAGALFFVNDRADVAIAIGADGVHIGPDDVPVSGLRPSTPAGFLIGASTDDPAIATRLVQDGADYIGCGTVYPTSTKDAGVPIGIDGLERVAGAVGVPVVGIGGIDARGSAEIAAGSSAAGVAVVGAVMRAGDVAAAVEALMAPWRR